MVGLDEVDGERRDGLVVENRLSLQWEPKESLEKQGFGQ